MTFLDRFVDLIFMKGLYWILVHQHGIYTKSPDETEAELFHSGFDGSKCWYGRILKPFFNEDFLLYLSFNFLIVIPIQYDFTPKEVIKIPKRDNTENIDFESFENKILIMTWEKLSMLIMVKEKIQILDEENVKGISGREEKSSSMSLCNEKKFLMIFRVDSTHLLSSSLLIYDVSNPKLIKKSIMDISGINANKFLTMSLICLEHIQEKVYFTGITGSHSNFTLFTFYYDKKENVIREDINYRKERCSDAPICKFVKKEAGEIVGISYKSKLLRIKFK